VSEKNAPTLKRYSSWTDFDDIWQKYLKGSRQSLYASVFM